MPAGKTIPELDSKRDLDFVGVCINHHKDLKEEGKSKEDETDGMDGGPVTGAQFNWAG